MTKSEYATALKDLEKEYRERQNRIHIEYAMSNNPYNVGDVLTDGFNTIKVIKIRVSAFGSVPQCVYEGVRLTKKFAPYKTGETASIYQERAKKVSIVI